jgi:hypothetical protein
MHTFQPAVRLVAVVAEIGAPPEGDTSEFVINTCTCPVLAVEALQAEGEDEVQYAGIICFRGELVTTNNLADGTEVQLVACPWPAEEDEARLRETVKELKESAQASATILARDGDLPFRPM